MLDGSGRDVAGGGAASVTNGEVEIGLPPSLPHGTYVASYRVVSLDGHPIGGSLVFSIGEPSTSANPGAPNEDAWRAIWIVVRAIIDACLLGSAGGVLFLLLVVRTDSAAASTVRIVGRFASVGLIAAALSIGVQGGSLAGSSIGEIANPATWRLGVTSTFGRSALIAIAGFALTIVGMRLPSRAIALIGRLSCWAASRSPATS